MSTRDIRVTKDALEHQHRASEPSASAWVSANAGSGKTHVLTQRVLRLLMTGVPPEAILCLTYTKTAAAEMRARLATRLGEWALADDQVLRVKLEAIGLAAADEAMLGRARALFARALETPGGLRIVTIHAFCEAVLHRFPLEAGVPFDFTVMEDVAQADLLLAIRETVLAEGLRAGDEAVTTLFAEFSDYQLTSVLAEALAEGRRLRGLLEDPQAAIERLTALVGPVRARDVIACDSVEGRLLDAATCRQIAASGKTLAAVALGALDPESPAPDQWRRVFLTDKQEPRKSPWPGRDVVAAGFAQILLDEQQRQMALVEEDRKAALLTRSLTLTRVLARLFARYDEAKRARSLLDFDDLIVAVTRLLGDQSVGRWVQYKLDAGIHHILVDESQDTNAEQWQVVDSLTGDFFAGAGQIDALRTVFSVGDPKQSIYSFQGAAPDLFIDMGRRFAARATEAGSTFHQVPLHVSFRTLAGVLSAVDKVFEDTERQSAVLELEKVHHQTARQEPGGTVTLWPAFVEPPAAERAESWPLEPVQPVSASAARQLARHVAAQISLWLQSGRRLASGRLMRADDVMILLQTRSALYHEIIRALGQEGLDTPGADRLDVNTHIAVLDLLALGDVLINRREDLQLAAVLRSPLFGLTDDQLFQLAADREGTLWQALDQAEDALAREARHQIEALMARARTVRPYELYADLLYAGGGMKKLRARLGPEVEDVVAEFLALALSHEQTDQPTLEGFLAEMRRRNLTIKRELGDSGSGVRVMTIHAAKGLEAPVVILADALALPGGGRRGARCLFTLDTPTGPVLLHAGRKDDDTEISRREREAHLAASVREYWRKLYVGMTRAEEALYVTGVRAARGVEKQFSDSWYGAMAKALWPQVALPAETELVYPEPTGETAPSRDEPSAPPPVDVLQFGPLSPHPEIPILTPSSIEVQFTPGALDTRVQSALDPEMARREGIALHALLDHLVAVPPPRRRTVAAVALRQLLAEDEARHEALADKATSILENAAFGRLFGPSSRGEVPFLVPARRQGKPVRLAGRFDRLVVDEAGVLVLDYKSDTDIPATPAATPSAYLTQLGLYASVAGQLFPGRPVAAAILWTSAESLMFLPPTLIASASADFTLG